MEKEYLGNSVYVESDDSGFLLTTENGLGPSNTIYLERTVLDALNRYMKRWYEEEVKLTLPTSFDAWKTTAPEPTHCCREEACLNAHDARDLVLRIAALASRLAEVREDCVALADSLHRAPRYLSDEWDVKQGLSDLAAILADVEEHEGEFSIWASPGIEPEQYVTGLAGIVQRLQTRLCGGGE